MMVYHEPPVVGVSMAWISMSDVKSKIAQDDRSVLKSKQLYVVIVCYLHFDNFLYLSNN
jgi:hypothetical protein